MSVRAITLPAVLATVASWWAAAMPALADTDTYHCQFNGVQYPGPPIPTLGDDNADGNLQDTEQGWFSLYGSGTCVALDSTYATWTSPLDGHVVTVDVSIGGRYRSQSCGTEVDDGAVYGISAKTTPVTDSWPWMFEGPLWTPDPGYHADVSGEAGTLTLTGAHNAERGGGSGAGAITLDPVIGDCVTSDVTAFKATGSFTLVIP